MTRQHLLTPNLDKAMLWNIHCYAERRNPRIRKPRREVLRPIHCILCFSAWIIIAFGVMRGIIWMFWKAHTFPSSVVLLSLFSPVSNIASLPCLSLPCRYSKYKVSTKRQSWESAECVFEADLCSLCRQHGGLQVCTVTLTNQTNRNKNSVWKSGSLSLWCS